MSSTKFRLSERLQWYEFIICLLLFFVPVTILCIVGNLNPNLISAPTAIILILAALSLSIVSVVLRKRGRILIIDGAKWTIQHEKSGKILMEFNLSLPHSFAVAVRQGITGKSITMRRWLQVFLAQNGKILRIETPYMESFLLKGNTQTEYCSQIGAFTNQLLKRVAGKPYTYDETAYFKEVNKVGNAVHGLSSFLEGLSDELLTTMLEVVESSLDQNKFLLKLNNMRNNNYSFSLFKTEFLQFTKSNELSIKETYSDFPL